MTTESGRPRTGGVLGFKGRDANSEGLIRLYTKLAWICDSVFVLRNVMRNEDGWFVFVNLKFVNSKIQKVIVCVHYTKFLFICFSYWKIIKRKFFLHHYNKWGIFRLKK